MTDEEAFARCIELGESITTHRQGIKSDADERRALIIVLHEQCGYTFRQIGEKLHLSTARISQIIDGS